jgi:hypothetical protein
MNAALPANTALYASALDRALDRSCRRIAMQCVVSKRSCREEAVCVCSGPSQPLQISSVRPYNCVLLPQSVTAPCLVQARCYDQGQYQQFPRGGERKACEAQGCHAMPTSTFAMRRVRGVLIKQECRTQQTDKRMTRGATLVTLPHTTSANTWVQTTGNQSVPDWACTGQTQGHHKLATCRPASCASCTVAHSHDYSVIYTVTQ